MKEEPLKALLDKETHILDLNEHFSEILNAMQDMTNYGTNLIVRCMTTSDKDLKDAIAIGVLLRQAVAMFDGLEILISNAAIYPAHLQARAIFEKIEYGLFGLKQVLLKILHSMILCNH